MDFDESVRTKVDEYRRATNTTQEQLAEKVGVSQNTISSWLNGRGISGKNLLRLAKAMNVSMDYLAGVGDNNEENAAEEITALSKFFNLSPSAQDGEEVWTLRISKHLIEYLKSIPDIEKAIAAGMPDEVKKYWLNKLQEKYRADVLNSTHGVVYDEFEVYPKGFLKEYDKRLRIEYGRIPAPTAGDVAPPREERD